MTPYEGIDPADAVIPGVLTANKGEWPTPQVPDDADERDAANQEIKIQALTDRTNFLAHRMVNVQEGGGPYAGPIQFTNLITPKADQYQYKTPTVFNRSIEAPGTPDWATAAFWDFVAAFWTVNSAAVGTLIIPLHLPHGSTLNSVTIYINPPSGHAAFPGGAPTMPSITVKRRTIATGNQATLETQADTSANAGAYQVAHAITATLASPHTVNRITDIYYVSLSTEGGGNAIAGTVYLGGSVNYTCSVAASE